MLGSLLLAIGILSCDAAGGNCESPSTQLVRAEQEKPSRNPNVTISDDTEATRDPSEERDNGNRSR